MKKITVLILAAVSTVITAKAQFANYDYNSKFTLSLTGGPAIPSGDMVYTGIHADLAAGYLFTDNLGAMVQVGGNINSTTRPVGENSVLGERSVYQYLLGPYFSIPEGRKIRIELRFLFGIGNLVYSYPTSVNPDPEFGMNLSVGVKYMVTKNIGLGILYGIAVTDYSSYYGIPKRAIGAAQGGLSISYGF